MKTKPLHIVQGGIENGDKEAIERAFQDKQDMKSWIVPRHAVPGDDVVVYIGGFGFFATASIKSEVKPRKDWKHRYGAAIGSLRAISPPISLVNILTFIPELTWANYPRSITTPKPEVAHKVRDLIARRRKGEIFDLREESLPDSNIDELRRIALLRARRSAPTKERTVLYHARAAAIKLYVLKRADGICEGCEEPAPFNTPAGSPFLEPHHLTRLADGGPDHPKHVIALCPNCHRRAHYSEDSLSFNKSLVRLLSAIENKNS